MAENYNHQSALQPHLPRPDRRPDSRPNLVINLVGQEQSGHGGDLVTNLVIQERSGRPEAIWLPIRSPEHLVVDLVVDLVVVDAFSLSKVTGPNNDTGKR